MRTMGMTNPKFTMAGNSTEEEGMELCQGVQRWSTVAVFCILK